MCFQQNKQKNYGTKKKGVSIESFSMNRRTAFAQIQLRRSVNEQKRIGTGSMNALFSDVKYLFSSFSEQIIQTGI